MLTFISMGFAELLGTWQKRKIQHENIFLQWKSNQGLLALRAALDLSATTDR